MLTCLLYRLLCCLVGVLARGGGERELELVVLRHQLAILRRGGKRPQYTTADRALLAAASRLLPQERWSCFAVSAQTLWSRHSVRPLRTHRSATAFARGARTGVSITRTPSERMIASNVPQNFASRSWIR